MIIERNEDKILKLYKMTLGDQHHELIRYGHIKADVSCNDYAGSYRTMVFDYYGSKWFMHLYNGMVMDIHEV